jgi:hypothetical protein
MASQAASHHGQREPLKRSFHIPLLTVWLPEKCVRLNKFTVLWAVDSLQNRGRHFPEDRWCNFNVNSCKNLGMDSDKSNMILRFTTGWTVQGSNSGEGEMFRTHPDRPWGLSSLLYTGHRASFPGVKRPGLGDNHPPSSSAEVKE